MECFGTMWNDLERFGAILWYYSGPSHQHPPAYRIVPTENHESTETDTLSHVEAALRDAGGAGLSQSELLQRLNAGASRAISKGTLLRRLRRLRDAHVIVAYGAGRATRYALVAAIPKFPDDDNYPALSPEGKAARTRVRRPRSLRTPVGYNPSLLRNYRPGVDWYLTEATRAQLHAIGRTPDAARPAGTFARDIYERLLIDLSWSSSRLEGNTYSLLDTKELLAHGTRAEGKSAEETQMVLNHKKAIELLVEGADDIGFNRYTLMNVHAALSENLLSERGDEGRLRERPVEISGTTYVPTAIPQLIVEMFDQFLSHANTIPDPFEQSFFAMVHIPYLQPFVDVNKRTSRLAANISLIKSNYCPLSFVDVPESAYVEGTLAIYEDQDISLLRDVFLWAYQRSAQQYQVVRASVHQPDPFRLRYRTELANTIQGLVRSRSRPTAEAVTGWMDEFAIAQSDRDRFSELARALIDDLHDGVLARYGLRPREYRQWQDAISIAGTDRKPDQ